MLLCLVGGKRSLAALATNGSYAKKVVCLAGKPSLPACVGHSTGLCALSQSDLRPVAKSNPQFTLPLHINILSICSHTHRVAGRDKFESQDIR